MRKELLYAIIAGISIGLIVAFGTWKISKVLKKDTPIVTRRETPTPKNIQSVSIDKYNNFDVVPQTITLSGLTGKNSNVIIITADSDYYAKSDNDGSFEKEIKLPSGLSEIKVLSFDVNNNNSEAKIKLVSDADAVEKSTSYIGTITDISSGNIQIKGSSGSILQVTAGEDTKFINSLKKNAEVKETDLAIGDYIVAMGTLNSKKVLNSTKVVVGSPLVDTKIEIIAGKIDSISKTKLSILKNNNEIEELTLPKKWNGPDIKELEEGMNIYIVGNNDGKSYTLRTIITPVE